MIFSVVLRISCELRTSTQVTNSRINFCWLPHCKTPLGSLSYESITTTPQDAHKRLVLQIVEWVSYISVTKECYQYVGFLGSLRSYLFD